MQTLTLSYGAPASMSSSLKNRIQLWNSLCFVCFPLNRGEPASVEWKKMDVLKNSRWECKEQEEHNCQRVSQLCVTDTTLSTLWSREVHHPSLCNVFTAWPLTIPILARRTRLNNSNPGVCNFQFELWTQLLVVIFDARKLSLFCFLGCLEHFIFWKNEKFFGQNSKIPKSLGP